uniref:RING-type E3 ubiquitin transferase n=1 Tax=Amazona collaria TaxID=241587 RepID=A0A8B9FHA4_9PSIT
MGDRRQAEKTKPKAACCHLFKCSMMNEARRLRTFRLWPAGSPVCPRDLVKAGFFFVGPRDEVQCFCCGGILKNWEPGDCPVAEHLKFFPSCKFIRGEAIGNQEMLPPQEAVDTVDGQFLSLLPGMDSEEAALPSEPEYPAMVTEEARLLTFHSCPRHVAMLSEALARAGFFYTGRCSGGIIYLVCICTSVRDVEGSDRQGSHPRLAEHTASLVSNNLLMSLSGRGDVVRCFYCNGLMRNWQFDSDPWWEHAKWFPGLFGKVSAHCFTETLMSLILQALNCLEELAVMLSAVKMGFDLTWVCKMLLNKRMMTGTSCISVSELTADLLQSGREESSSAEKESQLSTEEQLRSLQEEKMCKVCLDKDASVVFVPCGHLVACRECALNLRSCPICRADIQDRLRTFMS